MFNLDQKISEWRQQMQTAGVKNPNVLDELETHLREDVGKQIKSGMDASEAFESGVRGIGSAQALKLEFKKVEVFLPSRFVALAGIACCAVGVIFSLWMLLLIWSLPETNLKERILGTVAFLCVAMIWRYGDGVLPAIKSPRVRTLFEVLCCGASLGGMWLYTKSFVPLFLENPAGAWISVGPMLLSSLEMWAVVAACGAAARGLEKAAARTNRRYV